MNAFFALIPGEGSLHKLRVAEWSPQPDPLSHARLSKPPTAAFSRKVSRNPESLTFARTRTTKSAKLDPVIARSRMRVECSGTPVLLLDPFGRFPASKAPDRKF